MLANTAVAHIKAQVCGHNIEEFGQEIQENWQAGNSLTANAPAAKSRGGIDSPSECIDAIALAFSGCYPQVHDILCEALAEMIDKKPVGMLKSAFELTKGARGSPSTSQTSALDKLPSASALTVLAAVQDLDKATQVRTPRFLSFKSVPCRTQRGPALYITTLGRCCRSQLCSKHAVRRHIAAQGHGMF